MSPKRWHCPDCGSKLVESERGGEDRPKCPDCGFVRYRNPIVGVAVIIRDEQGRVLVGRRAKGVYAGQWCIPCGYVEWEEDVRDAARREFEEETGLQVEVGAVAAVHSNFHNAEQHTVGIWFEGRAVGGTLHPVDGELAELVYCDPADPPDLAFPTDQVVMADLVDKRPGGSARYLDLIRDLPGAKRADVTPIFSNPAAFDALVRDISTAAADLEIDAVAGIDALGLVLGSAVAREMRVGLVAVRKGGKLPGTTVRRELVDYSGEAKVLEIGVDAVSKGARVLVVDEWVETGAQVGATAAMLEELGANVAGIATIAMDDNERTAALRARYRCISFA